MANKVSFIIQLKDQFSATAAKIQGSLKSVTKTATDVERSFKGKIKSHLDGINKSALDAAKGLATMATAAKVLQIGGDFQDAIAELSAITGATGSNLKSLESDIMRTAKQFGVSQQIVAKAFTQTASAKSELLTTEGAVATVTAEALRLARAAGIDVPDAIRASIGALNQWNVGADQAARFVNVIAAGAKVGASEVGETVEALKNAGTVAAQFGLSFEETNSILQVFAKNEIKGAEAGTALRGTLSKLENFMGGRFAPSKIGIIKSLEMIEKMGLSNTKIIKEFKEENLRSILVLRQNIPLVKQWTEELTNTSVAVDQADTRLATFNASVDKAGVSIQAFAIKIFNGFEPVLTRLVDLFTFLLSAIEGVTSAVGSFVGQFIGAISTMDFSVFSFSEIASKFGEAFGLEGILLEIDHAWYSLVTVVQSSISMILNSIKSFVNQGIGFINALIDPLNTIGEKLGFGKIEIPKFEVPDIKATISIQKPKNIELPNIEVPNIEVPNNVINFPNVSAQNAKTAESVNNQTTTLKPSTVAPIQAANGSINGKIVVEATQGTNVKQINMKSQGSGLNMGVNMVAQNVR